MVGVFWIVLLGCRDMPVASNAGVERDSAGITIVEHAEPDWSSGAFWSLADTPSVVIGTVEGEEPYQLFQVSDAARAADGRIYLINGSTAQVRVFDAHGTYLGAMGRKGSGPGEFRYPSQLWLLPGDSVMVWDAPMGPRVVFAPDGSLARVMPVDRAAFMAQLGEGRATEDVRPLSNGGVLAAAWRSGQEDAIPNNQLFRPPFELVLVAADLASSSTLGTYGGIEQMFVMGAERRMPVTRLFSPHYQVALGGSPLRIVLGNGDRYELKVHDTTGALRQIIRRTTPPSAVMPSDRDSVLARRLARAEQQGRRQEAERLYAALPDQPHYPAHAALMIDLEGNLWVQEYRKPSDTISRWTIYDQRGRIAGTFETSRSLRIAEIGPDYLLAVEQDENDVERLTLYVLKRRP
jgi:hypothetical protein